MPSRIAHLKHGRPLLRPLPLGDLDDQPRRGVLDEGDRGRGVLRARVGDGAHHALLDEELLLGTHLVPPQTDRLLQEAEAEVPEGGVGLGTKRLTTNFTLLLIFSQML